MLAKAARRSRSGGGHVELEPGKTARAEWLGQSVESVKRALTGAFGVAGFAGLEVALHARGGRVHYRSPTTGALPVVPRYLPPASTARGRRDFPLKICLSADIESLTGLTDRGKAYLAKPDNAEVRERMTAEMVAAVLASTTGCARAECHAIAGYPRHQPPGDGVPPARCVPAQLPKPVKLHSAR